MREIWLRSNRRALLLGLIPPLLLSLMGLAVALIFSGREEFGWLSWFGWALTGFGALGAGLMLYLLQLPRLGYDNGHLLVYLRATEPYRVPIEIVECFFIGTAPSLVKSRGGEESKTVSVVVRLAESAKEWHDRDVKPALGKWCDGYITIRGTWCEPVSKPLLQRLNQRLIEAHRRQSQTREAEKT